ncbi:ABC transporter ATP-binding protein [Couchioplanes caeruleus]|uniref:ABC transporter domain-containing protein n=2 Tax=Couchioplanes caeruleus TaxID=56438 RepID=A0A1K0FCJ8_9ACTN|nr:ATP-binding cassette domain-containing protein [Couchioplanes caeruleus]OJF10472.1 hypothetical protein BG844_31925 [Couchioplanes caeruleus subsp. caeruleus]ROP32550.1 ABC transporter family protein [Couchioplanes caeruleus]
MSVLSARGAGVRRNRQWLFRDLDVSASAGDVVAIVGPPGSGRTTVLLALSQRFKLSAGRVELAGAAALGYVPGVCEPESVLTVAEHVRERALLIGRRADEVVLHGLDPAAKGFTLSPYEKRVLGLVLARIGEPQVVAVDAVDEGLDAGEREALWRLIADLAAEGVTVLVAAREVEEALVSTVVRLGGAVGEPVAGGGPVDKTDTIATVPIAVPAAAVPAAAVPTAAASAPATVAASAPASAAAQAPAGSDSLPTSLVAEPAPEPVAASSVEPVADAGSVESVADAESVEPVAASSSESVAASSDEPAADAESVEPAVDAESVESVAASSVEPAADAEPVDEPITEPIAEPVEAVSVSASDDHDHPIDHLGANK